MIKEYTERKKVHVPTLQERKMKKKESHEKQVNHLMFHYQKLHRIKNVKNNYFQQLIMAGLGCCPA